MIPQKLEIKNFLSYGATIQTIDFKDYPLICLSGRNGSGKSALLDAITWAVWGQARKIAGVAKADEGLLRLGQTHMMVSLSFEFNKRLYRVRREFAKTYGKNYVALDLELYNPDNKAFITLSDKTIRSTQAKIERLLGLDFDTFVNSAFIRQGHSNEFSKKSPKERKEIIARILGLSRYDVYKACSLDHAKTFLEERKMLTKLQEQIAEELSHDRELCDSFTKEKEHLKKLEEELTCGQKRIEKLEKDRLKVLQQKQHHELLEHEALMLQKKIDEQRHRFVTLVAQWRNVHARMLLLPSLPELEKEKQQLFLKEAHYRKQHQKSLVLHEGMLKAKEVYQVAYQRHRDKKEQQLCICRRELEHDTFLAKQMMFAKEEKEKRYDVLTEKGKQREKEKQAMKMQLKELPSLLAKKAILTAQFEKRRTFYQVFMQKNNWIATQLEELSRKKKVVLESSDPSCPLCEQVLTIKRKQFLYHKFKGREDFLARRHVRLSQIIAKLKKLLIDQHAAIEGLSKNETVLQAHAHNEQQKEKEYQEIMHERQELAKAIKEQERELAVLNNKIAKQQRQLTQKEKALEEELNKEAELVVLCEKLNSITKEREAIAYNKDAHQAVLSKINKLEVQLMQAAEMQQDMAKQATRKANIAHNSSLLKEMNKSLQKITLKSKEASLQAGALKSCDSNVIKAKEVVAQLHAEKQNHFQALGRLENELKRIERIRQEHEKHSKRLSFLTEEISGFQALSGVLGKDGLQALLIEEAIPEIEEAANAILARLTDNRSQIFIDSLRDLKKGGVKETLDIRISDESGVRPYEMFSGGEAFRIDFALRIAISKLLARRSGTPLQTLIIDEGFGSQDEDGLNRLMTAIHAIRRDFSRVIVVSHLSVFKDNFPVHFVIDKAPSGSMVSVVERG